MRKCSKVPELHGALESLAIDSNAEKNVDVCEKNADVCEESTENFSKSFAENFLTQEKNTETGVEAKTEPIFVSVAKSSNLSKKNNEGVKKSKVSFFQRILMHF